MVRIQLDIIQFFLEVNNNTYKNMHENSNNSILNRVYNTLHNQSTIKFYYITRVQPNSIINSV